MAVAAAAVAVDVVDLLVAVAVDADVVADVVLSLLPPVLWSQDATTQSVGVDRSGYSTLADG